MNPKKGMCRGTVLRTNIDYILRKTGEEGVEKIRRYLDEKGNSLDVFGIDPHKWYPLETRIELLRGLKEVFQWGDEKVMEMGKSAPREEIRLGSLLKYLASVEVVFRSAAKMWRYHYSTGEMKLASFENGTAVLRLLNFDYDPIMCIYLRGYFHGLNALLKANLKSVEETVCTHRGGAYHEFVIVW